MSSLLLDKLFSVAGKRVLVTGGGRGIGRMIAAGFLANGADVVIASRDAAALAETAAALPGPGRCTAIEANLTTRAGCEALAAAYGEAFGGADAGGGAARLDVLVNNSGVSWGEPLARESGKANWGWDKVLDVNVKAPFYLTRALLPHLDAGSAPHAPARVINVGSVAGIHPQDVPTHAYDVSKAALHHLTRKLAAEFARRAPAAGGDERAAPTGVTVNAIAPGFVPSRMSAGLAAWGADPADFGAAIPLGREGREADMAGAALFLASPAAAWMTGVILPVDGGTTGTTQSSALPDS